jgi:hypothetical protein
MQVLQVSGICSKAPAGSCSCMVGLMRLLKRDLCALWLQQPHAKHGSAPARTCSVSQLFHSVVFKE